MIFTGQLLYTKYEIANLVLIYQISMGSTQSYQDWDSTNIYIIYLYGNSVICISVSYEAFASYIASDYTCQLNFKWINVIECWNI